MDILALTFLGVFIQSKAHNCRVRGASLEASSQPDECFIVTLRDSSVQDPKRYVAGPFPALTLSSRQGIPPSCCLFMQLIPLQQATRQLQKWAALRCSGTFGSWNRQRGMLAKFPWAAPTL